MARVRIERDVGDDAEVGEALLQRAHGARHQALRMPGRRRVERLLLLRHDGKQRDRGNAERQALLGVAEQQVELLRDTPGSDGTGSSRFAPSSTNTG